VPDGNPIVDSVSGSAVDPSGKQVDFNLYRPLKLAGCVPFGTVAL
jgi:hypothetical protein